MPIGTREVEKIAELAHLKFDREELERFVGHFQQILEYFTQLETVSTEAVSREMCSPLIKPSKGKNWPLPPEKTR